AAAGWRVLPDRSARAARFARQPFGSQPLAIGVKRLLRLLMVAHGLFRLDPTCRIARLALLGCQGFASEGRVFSHAYLTQAATDKFRTMHPNVHLDPTRHQKSGKQPHAK